MSTINNYVIGIIVYLVVLNAFLFAIGSDYQRQEDLPDFINEPYNTDELEDYDTPEGLSLFKSMSFGYFINVDTIEEKSTRVFLRLLLNTIFQLIPLLILIFAGLDFVRGIG